MLSDLPAAVKLLIITVLDVPDVQPCISDSLAPTMPLITFVAIVTMTTGH